MSSQLQSFGRSRRKAALIHGRRRVPLNRRRNVPGAESGSRAFALPDLLLVLAAVALLSSLGAAMLVNHNARARQARCEANVKAITGAVLQYAEENRRLLPASDPGSAAGIWFGYKELVKGYMGLTGPPSPADKPFACPDDRGYTDPGPFYRSAKYNFGSYVFNGVTLPGVPNLAGKSLDTVQQPARTLLLMEWTAHAPLSWHRSRTGKRNHPFYNDAQSVVGFVDGHVKFIPIYYDGINPAYTRDPIPGYEYKYSPD